MSTARWYEIVHTTPKRLGGTERCVSKVWGRSPEDAVAELKIAPPHANDHIVSVKELAK